SGAAAEEHQDLHRRPRLPAAGPVHRPLERPHARDGRRAEGPLGRHAKRPRGGRRHQAGGGPHPQGDQRVGSDGMPGDELTGPRARLTARPDLLVVMTDQEKATALGAYGMMTKSGTLYDCMVRVPLAFSWPGTLLPGQTREELVSTLDAVPTPLRLAGVAASRLLRFALPHGSRPLTVAGPRDPATTRNG